MKTCSICKHPNRPRIDEAIIAGTPNLRIEKNFGVSRDAVRRHSKHVLAVVKKYDATQELAQAGNLKAKILMREGDLLRIQQKAEQRDDLPTAIAAIRELRQFHELQARMEGQLKPQEVSVLAVNLDEQTSRRMAETYLQRHPNNRHQDDES
jgi:trans-aconitate methyltransferase